MDRERDILMVNLAAERARDKNVQGAWSPQSVKLNGMMMISNPKTTRQVWEDIALENGPLSKDIHNLDCLSVERLFKHLRR